jgi:hypothetical protein
MTMPGSLTTQERNTVFPSPLLTSSPFPSAKSSESTAQHFNEGLPAEVIHRKAIEAGAHLARAQRTLCFCLVEMEKRSLYTQEHNSRQHSKLKFIMGVSVPALWLFLGLSVW